MLIRLWPVLYRFSLILLQIDMIMLIQEYQASWENDFNRIKEVILSQLDNLHIRIEHVGSTAIKDLPAKPIIDIDLVYEESVIFDEVKNGLENLGYNHIGNLEIEGREVFKREVRKTDHEILDNIDHHLYVCPHDSVELHRHITFRNYLRKNEKDRKEYEKIKKEIAIEANQERKHYAKIKEVKAREFVESVLKKAKTKSYQ